MSSLSQIFSNRQNAKSSTGPSTPEGKATSSHNATTHGLSGKFAVLPHEDRAEFDRMADAYTKKFRPADDHECFLIELMLQSRWKMARLQRLETCVLNQMAIQDPSATGPDDMLASSLLKGSANAYAQVQRYIAAAERSYYKALRELERGRDAADRERAASQSVPLTPVHPDLQNEPKSPAPTPAIPGVIGILGAPGLKVPAPVNPNPRR